MNFFLNYSNEIGILTNVITILGTIIAVFAYFNYKKQKHGDNFIDSKYVSLEKTTDLISSLHEMTTLLLIIIRNAEDNKHEAKNYVKVYEQRMSNIFEHLSIFQSDVSCMMEFSNLSHIREEENLESFERLQSGYRYLSEASSYIGVDSVFNSHAHKTLNMDNVVDKLNAISSLQDNLLPMIEKGSSLLENSWKIPYLEKYAKLVRRMKDPNE